MQLSEFDLNLFVALDALLETGQVGLAAERVGISASAMSHTLARLRRTFDDPLFVRSRGGLVPTPRAERLGPIVRRGLEELGRATRSPVFDPAATTHRFVIAGTDYIELALLPALLSYARDSAPGADFELIPEPLDPAQTLESGAADLLVASSIKEAPGIVGRTLFRDTFTSLVRSDHPTIGRRLTLRGYTTTPHVLFSPRGRGLGVVDRALAAVGEQRRVAVRLRHLTAAAVLAARTDLILTIPRRAARVLAPLFGMRCLTPPVALPELTMAASWHRRFQDDAGHRWLRGALVHAAK